MKISAIGVNGLNQSGLSNKARLQNKTAQPQTSLPISNAFYPIFFEGNGQKQFFKKILNMENICPCCGKQMLPQSVYNKDFSNEMLTKSSKEVIKFLRKYEDKMGPIEKQVFHMITQESKGQNFKSINTILQRLRPQSFRELVKREFAVLDKLEDLAQGLSEASRKECLELTTGARRIILADNPKDHFARKKFISNIAELRDLIPEKEVGDKMLNIAQGLTSSKNDIDAFIVKYSRRNPRETAQRLVANSVATIEHIKPQFHDGEDFTWNFLSECSKCNGERECMPLDEFITKFHPEMPENTQKHMNKIIGFIKQGLLPGFEKYPIEVAKTLEKESKGLIKLDISKLTPAPKRAQGKRA